MKQPWDPDHRGVWVIQPPKDMPIGQITMLQTTIAAYWEEYPGDPNDTELFWDFLTESMANVPRETSPSVRGRFPFQVDVLYRVNSGSLRTAQRTVLARDDREAVDLAHAQLAAVFKDATVSFDKVDVRVVADGGPVVDVPRETSGGDDASA